MTFPACSTSCLDHFDVMSKYQLFDSLAYAGPYAGQRQSTPSSNLSLADLVMQQVGASVPKETPTTSIVAAKTQALLTGNKDVSITTGM